MQVNATYLRFLFQTHEDSREGPSQRPAPHQPPLSHQTPPSIREEEAGPRGGERRGAAPQEGKNTNGSVGHQEGVGFVRLREITSCCVSRWRRTRRQTRQWQAAARRRSFCPVPFASKPAAPDWIWTRTWTPTLTPPSGTALTPPSFFFTFPLLVSSPSPLFLLPFLVSSFKMVLPFWLLSLIPPLLSYPHFLSSSTFTWLLFNFTLRHSVLIRPFKLRVCS